MKEEAYQRQRRKIMINQSKHKNQCRLQKSVDNLTWMCGSQGLQHRQKCQFRRCLFAVYRRYLRIQCCHWRGRCYLLSAATNPKCGSEGYFNTLFLKTFMSPPWVGHVWSVWMSDWFECPLLCLARRGRATWFEALRSLGALLDGASWFLDELYIWDSYLIQKVRISKRRIHLQG